MQSSNYIIARPDPIDLLESILDSGVQSPIPVPGQTRIERGFIGAHADIGGGFAEGENQLALVALNWIVSQATAAGVTMFVTATTVAANPFVHDKSDSIKTGAPDANAEDREVRYRNGSKTTQREMIPPTGMSFADTQNFIDYAAIPLGDPQRTQFKTGTVDMKGYLQWLNSNGYGITLTAP